MEAIITRSRLNLIFSVLTEPNTSMAIQSLLPFLERLNFLWTSTRSISQPVVTFLVNLTQFLNQVSRGSSPSLCASNVNHNTSNLDRVRIIIASDTRKCQKSILSIQVANSRSMEKQVSDAGVLVSL